jgi:hypothetical protein
MRSTQKQLRIGNGLSICLKTEDTKKTCVEMPGRRILRMDIEFQQKSPGMSLRSVLLLYFPQKHNALVTLAEISSK